LRIISTIFEIYKNLPLKKTPLSPRGGGGGGGQSAEAQLRTEFSTKLQIINMSITRYCLYLSLLIITPVLANTLNTESAKAQTTPTTPASDIQRGIQQTLPTPNIETLPPGENLLPSSPLKKPAIAGLKKHRIEPNAFVFN
jgi:hypothetical protein